MTELYTRDPQAFSPKAYALDHERRHQHGPDTFPVTAASHPSLFHAFETISIDSTGEAGHERYSVPVSLSAWADQAEACLAQMTKEERETVAAGDQDEAADILTRYGRAGGEPEAVQGLLNGFFDDWTAPDTTTPSGEEDRRMATNPNEDDADGPDPRRP